eukprot:scaffold38657_cov32-Phaeocystis_antarctica.AAC.2
MTISGEEMHANERLPTLTIFIVFTVCDLGPSNRRRGCSSGGSSGVAALLSPSGAAAVQSDRSRVAMLTRRGHRGNT